MNWTTTLRTIKSHHPCGIERDATTGWRKLVNYLGTSDLNTPVTLEQILDSNGLDDALWALRCWEDDPEVMRRARLYACRCACHVVHLNSDIRVRRAIETAALFAEGLADADEMTTAVAAAEVATRATGAAARAARSAAWAAVAAARAAGASRVAAWAAGASRVAAWAAGAIAGDTAWSAIWVAARAAERAWQEDELRRMISGEGYEPLDELL